MRLSQTGMGTYKLNNIDEMYPGQSILLQTGQLVQYGAGIFAYNTVPLLVKRNIEKIIVETLNKYGCIEVLLPTLQPDTIWKNSGRYNQYVDDGTMLITESNKGIFCLAPTGEEAMLEFAREKLKSYKNLPATFYQIGEKYRNEIRTRGYLLRGKAFPMLDAYSFDIDEKNMAKSYENVRKAFLEIFEKIGLNVLTIVADNGAMGGKKSEEFMLISSQGEDKILYDEKSNIGLNTEILEKENYEEYLKSEYGIEDISNFKEIRTMELGHIFQLGTRYSEIMNGKYIGQDGKENLYYMGCYGIGIGRLMASVIEARNDDRGPIWPVSIAPWKVSITSLASKNADISTETEAQKLYAEMQKAGIEVILDDRQTSAGEKFADIDLLGIPLQFVVSQKTLEQGKAEWKIRATGEKGLIDLNEVINMTKTWIDKESSRLLEIANKSKGLN